MDDKVAGEIRRILQRVEQLHAQGRYAEVISLAEQLCTFVKATLGETDPDYAMSLHNLAVLYQAMGAHAEAEPLYRQALAIHKAVLGETHPDYATNLHNLAVLYHDMSAYAEAEPLYRQALAIRKAVLGETHPDYATSLHNLAALYHNMGAYAEAEPLYRQALAIRKAVLGETHLDYATSLNDLALLYHDMGAYAEAEPLHRQTLAIHKAALGEAHPDYATSLNNLALLYQAMGAYAEAEPLYRQALAITQAALGEAHPDYATSLNNLALLYQAMGAYAEAEPLYRQALAIRKAVLGEANPGYAIILDNLALLYHDMGAYAEAEPLFRQALAIRKAALGEAHPDYATSLHNLALLYQATGASAEAEPLYRQALAIRKAALGEAHPYYARSLHNLAVLYHGMGAHAEAEPLFRQALAIRKAALGEVHPDYAASLDNLAVNLAAQNRAPEAWQCFDTAARAEDRIIGEAFASLSERRRSTFFESFRRSNDTLLSLLLAPLSDDTSAVCSGLDRVLRRKTLVAETAHIQRDAILGGRYPHLRDRLEHLHRLRAQIAEKMYAGPREPESPAQYQRVLQTWMDERDAMEAALAREIPELRLDRTLAAADRHQVAQHLAAGMALVEFVKFVRFDFTAVPAKGDARWKNAHYAAFVLPAGCPDAVSLIDLGDANPIDTAIAAFRARLENACGTTLRSLVFDPLRAALGDCKRLVISPDGELGTLPFEALPLPDGRHLIDAFEIGYVASGRDLLRLNAERRPVEHDAIVVADPDFDLRGTPAPVLPSASGMVTRLLNDWFGRRGRRTTAPPPTTHQEAPTITAASGRRSRDLDETALHFAPLPGSRIEGELVGEHLRSLPLLGNQALDARLKRHQSPAILHVATHGFFLPNQSVPARERAFMAGFSATPDFLSHASTLENPLLRAGLALAGVNTFLRERRAATAEAEDGLLTAEDVACMDLLDTELVFLSACETGVGEVKVGEGVLGLRSAVITAGARTLIVSLWKVDDLATAILAERFYKELLDGASKAQALRGAQHYLRTSTLGELQQTLPPRLRERLEHTFAAQGVRLGEQSRPFANPYYWAAFICQGDPGPLHWRPTVRKTSN